MCRSVLLIATSLFLFYCFAMWPCIIYFTLMYVITGQSTSWSVMGISDIVIYVKKAFVHIFMLKPFCLPIEEEYQQLFMGWGRYFDFHKHLKYYMSENKSTRTLC